jgi:hypothetical protein
VRRSVGFSIKISSSNLLNGCILGVAQTCVYRLLKTAPSTLDRWGQPLEVGYRRAIKANARENKESKCNHLRFIFRGEGVGFNVEAMTSKGLRSDELSTDTKLNASDNAGLTTETFIGYSLC